MIASCTSSGTDPVSGGDGLLGSAKAPEELSEQELVDLRAYCPKTVLRAGTETLRLFPDGVSEQDEGADRQLRLQANILEVVRECNTLGGTMGIRVGFAGRAINGPTGEQGTFELPIRVAVTRGEEVLYSQLHQIPVQIIGNTNMATFRFVDEAIAIPKPDKENLLIQVGFDEGPYDNP